MSDEDKTVNIPDSLEEFHEDIDSTLQQTVEGMVSTICTEGNHISVQEASETQEEEASVDQKTTMNETSSTIQGQDDETKGDMKQCWEASAPKNQSFAFGEGVSENTTKENTDKNIDPVIEAFLTQKLMEIEHKLSKDIHNEVQSALNNELKKYQDGNKYKEIFFAQNLEQVSPEDINPLRTVQGVTSFISDKITYWRKLAQEEGDSARKTNLTSSSGFFTVICLDISGSMKEHKAWDQAKIFCTDYLNGLKDLNKGNNTIDKVALVVFGTETKVCRRFTSDFDSLKLEFDNLKPDGPSPMFGGLVLSVAEAEISDKRYPNSSIKIWPKIILISDGRPTPLENMDDSEENPEGNAQETKKLILDETKRLGDKRIELNIVHVGKADYNFLHQLREYTSGIMMPYTDGEKTAQCNLIKLIREVSKSKTSETKSKADDSVGKEKSEADCMLKYSKTLKKIRKAISKMLSTTPERYNISDDKRYPTIGSRVRRSKDWTWGEQDDNGVGTIIGHNPKEPSERQYWVWVEWDQNADANIYRFKALPGTKSDVQIVHDERIPPDDCQIAVGMKVTTGKDFKGKKQEGEGVVIRIIYPDDPAKGSKAEVLWEDGTRAEYCFGDEGTDVEIKPRTVFGIPEEPKSLKVRSVSDTEVCIKWERPAFCGGCMIKKYTVFRKSDHEDTEWLQTTEVDGSQTSATICDLLPKVKYKFSVRAENKIGFGKSAETESTTTLDLKDNRPQAPVGPVHFLEITKGSCKLSWQKGDDNPSEPITHFLIEHREKNGKWKSTPIGLDTSFKMSGLRKSTKYEVRIKAVNENGESDPLGIDTFQTLTLLDHDIPDAELQDTHITELSQGIGHNWEMLGPHFNRENVEISRIKMDHPQSVVLQITSMLSQWKREMGPQATMHAFLKGVEKFPTVDVNWDIIEKVARQFRNEASSL